MERGPCWCSFWSKTQRAGESVRMRRGRFSKLNTSSGRSARPSCTRFHAASKRSSASAAAPMRISSFLDIAFEVVAQLLDRAEGGPALGVVGNAAPGKAIAQIVVQLDLE